jgi:hypothetical protein
MNLCSDGHDEVCYTGRLCPVCDVSENLNNMIIDKDETIRVMQKEINDLNDRISL